MFDNRIQFVHEYSSPLNNHYNLHVIFYINKCCMQWLSKIIIERVSLVDRIIKLIAEQ